MGWLKDEKWITVDDHDKYDNEFRDKLAEIDTRLSMLQEADEKYFDTVESILSLTKRASRIFESSNSEEKAILTNMLLLNLTRDNKKRNMKPTVSIIRCWQLLIV